MLQRNAPLIPATNMLPMSFILKTSKTTKPAANRTKQTTSGSLVGTPLASALAHLYGEPAL